MPKEELVEDFMISYGEALANIGFSTREIMKMSSYGLRGAQIKHKLIFKNLKIVRYKKSIL